MVIARRSRAAVVLSLLVSGVVLSSSAASAGAPDRRPALPKGATDITGTAKGQKLIREAKGALRRTRAQGGRAARRQGRYRDPDRTRRHDVRHVYRHAREREHRRGARPAHRRRSGVGPGGSRGEVAALAAPTWTFVKNHCFSQISDTWAVLDHCYYKFKLANDGSSSYDWYALQRYGTAHRNSPWVLDLARIRAYRSGGSSQSWADWNPRVDWYGGSCSTTSIGISTPVGGISKSFERCPDQVTFSKSANGTQPDYTQTWFGLGTRGNRELNFEIAVRVAQGGTASFAMPADVNGSPY